jgi:hypothetical protein
MAQFGQLRARKVLESELKNEVFFNFCCFADSMFRPSKAEIRLHLFWLRTIASISGFNEIGLKIHTEINEVANRTTKYDTRVHMKPTKLYFRGS